MCERLLANPLIEDYEIVESVASGEGARSASGHVMPEAEHFEQNAGLEAPRRTS
jgi:hypothetical protein